MPQLTTRGKHERAVAALLLLLFGDEYEHLRGGGRFRPVQFQDNLERGLRQGLQPIYADSALNLLEKYQVQKPIDAIATRWANRYSVSLAGEIAANTKARLAEFDRLERLEQADAIGDIFGPGRAEAIAITETTRGISAGEWGAVDLIKDATRRVLLASWATERDERVCPICEPLDLTTKRVWGRRFPGGPPAHPRCRCWLEWE